MGNKFKHSMDYLYPKLDEQLNKVFIEAYKKLKKEREEKLMLQTPKMKQSHEFLTLKEASKVARVHPMTMYRLVRENKVKPIKLGSTYRFRTDFMQDLMVN